mgnify:CR=1 FL=1
MQVIEQILDSREVAEMIEKDHSKLLRDIRTYIEQLSESKIGSGDFFRESTYLDTNNQRRPCFNVTRKGCEFIANKLTGTKGTAFTARYINRFHEMESIISSQSPAVAPVQPEKMEQIEKEYADLKKEIRGIKSDLKRIGRSGGLQTVAYSGRWQYKDWIIKMLYVIDESEDERFLRQMYTLFKKHLERKNDFRWMA